MKRITIPTFSEFIREAIRADLLDLHVSMPGKVDTYDHTTQKASIVPLIKTKLKDYDSTEIEIPVLNNVPVRWDCANGGESFIHLPLKPGDTGMIMFTDRSIDNYLSISSTSEIVPLYHDNPRHHDLNDTWFIPGIRPFAKSLQNTSADDIIIKNGDLTIQIDPDGAIAIKNSEISDLINLLHETLTYIKDARVLTMMGPQGFLVSDIALIEANLTLIETYIK
jgi:hypothetical protein